MVVSFMYESEVWNDRAKDTAAMAEQLPSLQRGYTAYAFKQRSICYSLARVAFDHYSNYGGSEEVDLLSLLVNKDITMATWRERASALPSQG